MAAGGELSIKTDGVANMWGLISSNFDTIGGFAFAPIRPAGAEVS